MQITDEDREKLGATTIVASVSGGKDSAALALWLREQEIEPRRVFADTGWESTATYDYLRGPLTAALGPIDEVRMPITDRMRRLADDIRAHVDEYTPPLTDREREILPALLENAFALLAIDKGMFPSRLKRFCTTELKVKPIQRYVLALEEDVTNAVGIRAAESAARASMTRWEWSSSFDCWVWRPLIAWSEQDVIDIHTRHGLRPNALYLRGASRVGCWPCINARKKEIALVADLDQERIDMLRLMERLVGDAAYLRAENRAAAGKEPFVFRNRPTFFHSHGRQQPNAGTKATCEACAGEGGHHVSDPDFPTGQAWKECEPCDGEGVIHTKVPMEQWKPDVPIDEIVKWARTDRGGRQYALFEDTDDGCVRWGLCEGDGSS